MKRARRTAGYTLPELMIAGTISAFLMLVMWDLLIHGSELAAENQARDRMNTQARQAFEMLAYGGTDDSTAVPGVRSGEDLPDNPLRDEGRLRIANGGAAVLSDTGPESTILCIAPLLPDPACLLPGQTITVQGWFREDPDVVTAFRSVAGRTAETSIQLEDPWLRLRTTRKDGSEVETYRTIFHRQNEGEN